MKKYAIIGAGAIGGYCAIKLIQAGFDVHCLLRSDFEYVKQHGLSLKTETSKVTVPVNAYQNTKDMPLCDVILVTLKTTQNDLLKEMLAPIMHKDSIVVLLQNGIGIEQKVAKFIPAHQIVGGSAMLKVSKEAGLVHHYGLNSVEFAQYYADPQEEGVSPKIKALAEDFNKADIESKAWPHLPTLRWKKLAGNIPMNGLSVVLDASSLEIANNEASHQLVCLLTKEVIDAAKGCGAKISDDFYQFRMSILESYKTAEKNYTSMKIDYDAKRPLELESIYGNAISLAKENGISMPLTQMLYQELIYLNEKNIA